MKGTKVLILGIEKCKWPHTLPASWSLTWKTGVTPSVATSMARKDAHAPSMHKCNANHTHVGH